MKRIILSLLGTVVAIVALLSFKTHASVHATAGALPSASLASTSSARPQTTTSAGSSAPPDPTPRSGAASTSAGQARTTLGSSVQTRYGIVQVKVVIAGTKIASVSFQQLTAFDGHSAQINAYAGPLLLQQTLKAQSSHVDGVSGATYTSDGYRTSLQYALDQAGFR